MRCNYSIKQSYNPPRPLANNFGSLHHQQCFTLLFPRVVQFVWELIVVQNEVYYDDASV